MLLCQNTFGWDGFKKKQKKIIIIKAGWLLVRNNSDQSVLLILLLYMSLVDVLVFMWLWIVKYMCVKLCTYTADWGVWLSAFSIVTVRWGKPLLYCCQLVHSSLSTQSCLCQIFTDMFIVVGIIWVSLSSWIVLLMVGVVTLWYIIITIIITFIGNC